jgi:outer membrane usher protein FimD/PapC
MRRRRSSALAWLAATAVFSRPALALELDRALHQWPAAAPVAPSESPALTLRASPALAHRTGPGSSGGPPTQLAIVSLTVNAEPRGERMVRMTREGEFLLRRDDVAEIGVVPPATSPIVIEGVAFFPVAAIARAKTKFDEATLTLELTLPPESFAGRRFDLATAPSAPDLTTPARSVLLNYRAAYAGTSGAGEGTLSLASEAALVYGDWILRNQSFHSHAHAGWHSSRIETQAIRDDRDNLRRLIVGDNFTPGLTLGSAVPFAGLTFAKAYVLSPYFSRQPSVDYHGVAQFPSRVDFYVGNTLVLRQQVGPGPFDIRNFSYYGGQRDVRVVIRDSLGREQTVAYPFYFATQGLAEGLHDYSYQAGWLRHDAGAPGDGYGPFAFSAFHQYGFSDRWTLGARAEGTSRRGNAGVDVFYRHERLGVFAVHAAGSVDRDRDENGHAFAAVHSFTRGEISTQLIYQAYSPEYAVLAQVAPRLPRRDFSANVAYAAPWLGSLSLGFTHLELNGELVGEAPARSVNLTYSRPLLDNLQFQATARQSLREPRGTELFVGLQYILDRQTAQASFAKDPRGVRTSALQFANTTPQGEGVGYSMGAQRQEAPEGTTDFLVPRVEWNTRYGTLAAEGAHSRGLSNATTYSLAFSGAIMGAEGRFGIGRAVADSFAIVEISPPLEGVLVYQNSQEAGRTDARGRVLLPDIASYATNYAAVKDKDVPIDYSIDKVGRSFAPPLRSGTLVPFHFERVRAFTGTLRYRLGDETRPLEYQLVELDAAGKRIEIPTGKGGTFYAENLPAGRHHATVRIQSMRCEFFLEVPPGDEPRVALGDIMACHVAR